MQSLFKFKDKGADINKLSFLYLELAKEGLPEFDIRKILAEESDKQSPYRTEQTTKRMVDIAIKFAKNGMKLEPNPISFSHEELDYIHSFRNEVLEKELFILFCLYKCHNGKPFNYKKRTFCMDCKISIKDFDLSNIIKEQNEDNTFYRKIPGRKAGGVLASDYIKSLYNENNIAFTIEKYDNVIYYYDYYFNPENYIFCYKCGKIVVKTKGNQRYCKECAKEIKNGIKYKDKKIVKCSSCGKYFEASTKSKVSLCMNCYKRKRKKDVLNNIKKYRCNQETRNDKS